MGLRVDEYALIGDTHAAGLVGIDGSIDWLCLPRFDSGACFAAILGEPRHGRWRLAPAVDHRVCRRYCGDTLVLETQFTCRDGVVRVIDCMSPRNHLPEVIRIVEGVRGHVRMAMELIVRFDYGSILPWVRRIGDVLTAVGGPDALCLRTPVPVQGKGMTTVAEFTIREGQRAPFVLAWYPSHEDPPPPVDPMKTLDETEAWWRAWSERCTYDGRWREAVIRSAITLKALTYAPTGGLVAAPTTSLPERLGGTRNWDYRFCWIRDATLALYALMSTGFVDEARAWRDWLLRAAAGDPAELQTLYGPGGERRIPELLLDWLPGYEGSRPVRVGNAAVDQFQLDLYGELMDCMHTARLRGIEAEQAAWEFEKLLVRHVIACWQQPDEGMWEVRGGRRPFTHSKVMAWVAVDRAIKAVERYARKGPVEHWRRVRAEMHEQICRVGYDSERNTFTQSYGSDEIDASLLMLPLVGFLPATDPRMKGTVEAIERELLHDGLVLRYSPGGCVDGLPPGEGVFLPCSFWLADNYVLQGRRAQATELFERLLSLRSDVGLLAEEYDPTERCLLGNYPQAFTHVALINTAMNLDRLEGPAHGRSRG